MGGNALKSIPLIRLTKNEFEPYTKDVIDKLYTKYSYISPLKYYRDKETFGDLDLILKRSELISWDQVRENLKELFQTKETYKNDYTISFEYKNFQVDLIFAKDDCIETTEFFFAANDLNNLVGRVANAFGLKLGVEGLHYVIRSHHGVLKKRIEVSKDPQKIYDFLGYSYNRFLLGFNTTQEIFDFVLSSKYFSSKIFAFENLNHTNRTRNRKRVNYTSFVDYIEKIHINDFEWKNESEYLQQINDFFPESHLIDNITKLKENFLKNKELDSKFTGSTVIELTELTGSDLGSFIFRYKEYILNIFSDFREYLGLYTKEEIKEHIQKFYKTNTINNLNKQL